MHVEIAAFGAAATSGASIDETAMDRVVRAVIG
jgi:hypothetical protein